MTTDFYAIYDYKTTIQYERIWNFLMTLYTVYYLYK